jgi:hypothetical protein
MKMVFSLFEIELRKKEEMKFAKELEALCRKYAKKEKDGIQNYDFLWKDEG